MRRLGMRLGRSEDYSTIFWVIPACYIKSYITEFLPYARMNDGQILPGGSLAGTGPTVKKWSQKMNV